MVAQLLLCNDVPSSIDYLYIIPHSSLSLSLSHSLATMAAMNSPQSQPVSFGHGDGPSAVHVPRTRSPSRAPTPTPTTPQQQSGGTAGAFKALLENMKQMDLRIEAVIAAGQAHDQRIIKLEADAKVLGDGMGTLGRHVQSMDDRVRAHIGCTVGDLNQALLAIDVALRKTVSAM